MYSRVCVCGNYNKLICQVMVFHITFMLAYSITKNCCNYINLFPCILWDFILLALVLSWWRLLKELISQHGSQVVQPTNVTWGAHAGSWRVSEFRDSSRELAKSRDDPRNALTVRILSMTLILFTHIIYTLISHKIKKRLFIWKTLERFPQHPPFKESYSSLNEKSL